MLFKSRNFNKFTSNTQSDFYKITSPVFKNVQKVVHMPSVEFWMCSSKRSSPKGRGNPPVDTPFPPHGSHSSESASPWREVPPKDTGPEGGQWVHRQFWGLF